jgi:hypothetical protein
MIAEARITVTKAVVDAEFAKALAVGLNENPAYRNAVTSLDALNVASNRLQSTIEAIVKGLGAAAGGLLISRTIAKSAGSAAASTAKTTSAAAASGAGGNFAGYKMVGKGENAMLQRPNGEFATKAERAAFDKAVKMGKIAKYTKVGSKALGVAGAGLDAYDRYKQGQSTTQIAAGVGTAAAAGWAGAAYGAQLGAAGGPFAWATVPAGALIGGGLGYFVGGKAADAVTGVGQPAKKVEQVKQTQQVQQSLDTTTQLLTAVKNIELLVADIAGYQATPATVQMIMDGKDISNSLIKHTQNMKGTNPRTTLRQSLAMYK